MRQTVANILREVAQEHGLTVAALIGQGRSRHIAWPRQEAYYKAFTECPHLSYPEIARRIGGRDHTTVYWGVLRHCKRIGQPYSDAKAMRANSKAFWFVNSVKSYGHVMEVACAY